MTCIMPWRIKRWIMVHHYGFKIDKTAHIGLSYIFPKQLEMGKNAQIGHFNIAIHLDSMKIGANSSIGRSNWITGFPTGTKSKHFSHDKTRKCELIIGKESAITKKHHIDCTNAINIGDYVTIAGYNSQLLTHSIDIYQGRQDSHPIKIGDRCFISTNVNILGGAVLPSFCVLGAGAVLNKAYTEEWQLYGGVPARPIKALPKDAKYFCREIGFVY